MKKILSLLLVVLTLVTAVVPAMAADTTGVKLSMSSVDDDLKLYDSNYLTTYHVDYADTGIHLITMQEDGYSPDGKTADYALYLYLYNPSQKQIVSSDYNSIQIAHKWENSEPVGYAKFAIDLVSISTNRRFIKVKLSGSKYPSSAFCCTNKDGSRSYSVSGIELYGQDTGVKTADLQDYSLAYTYTFSGYSTNNTLVSKRADLTTIMLDVHQTSYLTGDSGKETHDLENGTYSNQVNSVYFTIPTKFEESLGKLYSIDYEYYQYRTAPILITDNQTTYDTLLPNQAKPLNGDNAITMVEPFFFYDLLKTVTMSVNTYNYYGYCWGMVTEGYSDHFDEYPELGTVQEYFTALLKCEDITDRDNILISAETLKEYFKSGYTPLDDNGVNIINHSGVYVGSSKYNGDLFDLDYTGFKENYIRQEVTIDESFSLPSLADTLPSGPNGFWKNLIKYGWDVAWNRDDYDNSLDNVKYIQKVTSSDISSNDRTASDALLVSYNDVAHLRNTVTTASRNDEVVYLLRYAASDDFYYLPLSTGLLDTYDNVAMVQETVYLDFDIIELSFKDSDNKVTVIPVSTDPTDGFTGIENPTPPDTTVSTVIKDLVLWGTGIDNTKDSSGWLTKLMGVVLVGVGIYLIVKVFGVIVSAVSKAFSNPVAFIEYSRQKAEKRQVKRYRKQLMKMDIDLKREKNKSLKSDRKRRDEESRARIRSMNRASKRRSRNYRSSRRSRSYGRNNRYRY